MKVEAEVETVGQRLYRLRIERGMSQRDLAIKTLPGKRRGVTAAYISRIEKGERNPSVTAIRGMAAKLGVSPDYLETGRDAGTADVIYVAVPVKEIDAAARRWKVRLRMRDLTAAEKKRVLRGLEAQAADAIAARLHTAELLRKLEKA